MDFNKANKCEFGDDLVAYLYNEMTSAARSTFEEHLVGCEACRDEFAGIAQARFEVFDWKREEFDALATPSIAVPYGDAQVGWVERFRTAFGWATVVPAMAAVLVVLGVGYVMWSNSAVKQVQEVAANVATAPQAPVQASEAKNIVAPEAVISEKPSVAKAEPTVPTRKRIPRSDVAESRTGRMPVAPIRAQVKTIRPGDAVAVNMQPNAKPAPRLTAYNEDDDSSLRLSDLFDEAGPPEDR